MRSTIKDVAEKAGVSIATVSRAFNESHKVKEATRTRVLAIAHKLKYTPNAAARGLIMNRSEAIGLLLPDLHGEFFSEFIRGADETVQANGYHLIVSSSHNDVDEIESALRFVRGRVDGLVVMSPLVHSEILLRNIPRALPVVVVNCGFRQSTYDTISIDGFGGARTIVRYLLDLGHRRIAIIKGSDVNVDALARLSGYRTALQERGVVPDPTLEFDGDFTDASGYKAAQAIVQAKPRPTAIFASNDTMAISAIGALREAGLHIPEDISVCGFDDIPVARYLQPALTSVHVPIRDLGFMSIEMILKRLQPRKRKEKASQILVATTLSVRASCGPITEGAASSDDEHLKAGDRQGSIVKRSEAQRVK